MRSMRWRSPRDLLFSSEDFTQTRQLKPRPRDINIRKLIHITEDRHLTPIRAVALAALLSASGSAQPIEAKLNDFTIAVDDLPAAKRLYSSLGFLMTGGRSGSSGEIDNSMSAFRDGGGLALFATRERVKAGDSQTDLEIVSAEQVARELNRAGLKMNDPRPGSRTWNLTNGPVTTKWLSLRFAEHVNSRPVYFVQILDVAAFRIARPRPAQPNSAISLSALLIAVNDPDKAAAGYGNIGKLSPTEIKLPEFGAFAKEIILARGSIFLLRSADPSGPTAQHLKSRGEGILGVRLAVSDLDQTRKVIGEKNISKDKRFVLVSPENAAGAWLQFLR